MTSAANNVEFDETLFDDGLEFDCWIDSTTSSSESGRKRLTARRKVKDIKERPFQCDLCYLTFPQSSGLSRHRKEVHGLKRKVTNISQLSTQPDLGNETGPNKLAHKYLVKNLSTLNKEELLYEFNFLHFYVSKVQELLLK